MAIAIIQTLVYSYREGMFSAHAYEIDVLGGKGIISQGAMSEKEDLLEDVAHYGNHIRAFEQKYGVPTIGLQYHPEKAINSFCYSEDVRAHSAAIIREFLRSAGTHFYKKQVMHEIINSVLKVGSTSRKSDIKNLRDTALIENQESNVQTLLLNTSIEGFPLWDYLV